MILLHQTLRVFTYSRPLFKNFRCYCSNLTRKERLKWGPGLKDFIQQDTVPVITEQVSIPYVHHTIQNTLRRKVFFDVYGCQMNISDTQVVWSILKKEGFEKTEVEKDADIILLMTCAIREGAETKIWHRLDYLRGLKRRRGCKNPLKIGILGCMAERLKERLLEKEKAVDLVAGPDSYRDLPRLLILTESGQTAVNVQLSWDETYADVIPVRLNKNSVSAFISIMRGCDNMCTYCIVPFTRGRERSRAVTSIIDEVYRLAEQGVKDVTLLGQNVNSYRDVTQQTELFDTKVSRGFKTVYKSKKGGLRFADLLDKVSSVDPEMRIRFTAAHPKDFPDEVLQLISERQNICKLVHLPAQSGSNTVLERMRRGYTRESYLELVKRIKEVIPGVGLSTDLMCGFCGETEAEFEQTLSLIDTVDYNTAFLFIYSMREKTTAHRRYEDDVPEQVKKDRHQRLLDLYTKKCAVLNNREIGSVHLVLVEDLDLKKTGKLYGRNEFYIKVCFEQCEIPFGDGAKCIKPGDYVAVHIVGVKGSWLIGMPLYHTNLRDFYKVNSWGERYKCND